jgi:hypothetical protein
MLSSKGHFLKEKVKFLLLYLGPNQRKLEGESIESNPKIVALLKLTAKKEQA